MPRTAWVCRQVESHYSPGVPTSVSGTPAHDLVSDHSVSSGRVGDPVFVAFRRWSSYVHGGNAVPTGSVSSYRRLRSPHSVPESGRVGVVVGRQAPVSESTVIHGHFGDSVYVLFNGGPTDCVAGTPGVCGLRRHGP